MTRDEAVKIVTVCNPTPYPQAFVQALEALKLLKLDEPKPSPDARFSYAVARWVEAGSHAGELPVYVSAAGLKIINSQ